jgi:hypothetical protein
MNNENTPNLQTAVLIAETAKLLGSVLERVDDVETRVGVSDPVPQDGVPAFVEVDIAVLLQRFLQLLTQFMDELDALKLQFAASEAAAGENDKVLRDENTKIAARIVALEGRVAGHDELFETVAKISDDFGEMRKRIEDHMARQALRRKPPQNPGAVH